jgi:myosin heavy subunit
LRAGTLAQLEDSRDETITDNLIELQAFCRGYLARKKLARLKVSFCIVTILVTITREYHVSFFLTGPTKSDEMHSK